ncbi:MAG: hypothetical protein ACRDX8_00930 [Acidimicrobiales bacterium]
MPAEPPRPATDIRAADWIRRRLGEVGTVSGTVSGTVPAGFAAYARILHPARCEGRTRRWDEVALPSGRRAHSLMQFEAISRPLAELASTVVAPEQGNLEPVLLEALCETLARHTAAAKQCWFALWEGHGWIHEDPSLALLQSSPSGATGSPRTPPTVRPAF